LGKKKVNNNKKKKVDFASGVNAAEALQFLGERWEQHKKAERETAA